jgi:cytoskeletal protein RodZ
MNRRALLILSLVVLVGGLAWWWKLRGLSQNNIPATASNLSEIRSVKPASIQIPPSPVSAPTTTPKSAVASSLASDAIAATDSPKDINATISAVISLVQTGNLVTVFKNYTSPSTYLIENPDAENTLEETMKNWENTPESQIFVQVLQAMKDETPTYNDAVDRATYNITDPTGRNLDLRSITLQKIDGEWRFTHTDIMRGAAGFGLNKNPPTPI